jgi:hypothetical protein
VISLDIVCLIVGGLIAYWLRESKRNAFLAYAAGFFAALVFTILVIVVAGVNRSVVHMAFSLFGPAFGLLAAWLIPVLKKADFNAKWPPPNTLDLRSSRKPPEPIDQPDAKEPRIDLLERLVRLKDSGALTEEEFAAEKKKVMEGP